jgi:pimeloyl-ACP methyl ester carboxylesterase
MFNFKIIGKGKPVLFIHGFLESLTMWEVFDMNKFPFQSILIDLPGHGKSDFNNDFISISDLALKLHDFLQKRGFETFDIVGHSLGGYVAIELHKLLLVKGKLVLFHSTFLRDTEEKKVNRNRVIEAVKQNKHQFLLEAIPNLFLPAFRTSPFVEKLILEAKEISKQTIIKFSELMRDRYSNEAYIFETSKHITVFQGELDPIIEASSLVKFKEIIQLIQIKNAGHMGHFEQTNESFYWLNKCLNQP